ncbi:hypothetical protein [Pseudomonas coleopterorum]|uniref:Uncharacterized protein n=1 Tax=Pseudomonas coleopterorum TaxID=1605838 RepID=A0AAJ6LY73_9PSED|nr:hypothetical protein [Pseudomonas coleopterorum]WNC09304.1 hypothetical protein RI108_18865 [Pseudomonas coleopterorum]
MTTNVYDQSSGFITSDSRWSVERDFAIMYVDDTGFDKIEEARGKVFLFAGDSETIQLWKTFLRSGPLSSQGRPAIEGIAILIAEADSGRLVYHYGQDILLPDSEAPATSFAGSGARSAAQCWQANKCAKKAVETAKSFDLFSGGEVKSFELSTGKHNLNDQIDVKDLKAAFIKKGMVMFTANSPQQLVTVQEAAANDPRVAEIVTAIANGNVSLKAPCDAMYNQPTHADKKRLDAALDEIFA